MYYDLYIVLLYIVLVVESYHRKRKFNDWCKNAWFKVLINKKLYFPYNEVFILTTLKIKFAGVKIVMTSSLAQPKHFLLCSKCLSCYYKHIVGLERKEYLNCTLYHLSEAVRLYNDIVCNIYKSYSFISNRRYAEM